MARIEQDTSIAAYNDLYESGYINRLQRKVLFTLWKNPGGLTNDEIPGICGERYKNTQPRVSELFSKGLVVAAGLKLNAEKKRKIIVWKTKND